MNDVASMIAADYLYRSKKSCCWSVPLDRDDHLWKDDPNPVAVEAQRLWEERQRLELDIMPPMPIPVVGDCGVVPYGGSVVDALERGLRDCSERTMIREIAVDGGGDDEHEFSVRVVTVNGEDAGTLTYPNGCSTTDNVSMFEQAKSAVPAIAAMTRRLCRSV